MPFFLPNSIASFCQNVFSHLSTEPCPPTSTTTAPVCSARSEMDGVQSYVGNVMFGFAVVTELQISQDCPRVV